MLRKYRRLAKRIEKLAQVGSVVWNLGLHKLRFNEALLDAYGRCWYNNNIIELRLTTLKDPCHLLPEWHLRDTLAHELAHLVEHGHTRAHRELRDAIKLWLKLSWYVNFKI